MSAEEQPADATTASVVQRARWRYVAYAFELVVALGLSAFVLRRIGAEHYGVFVLANSTCGLLTLLDLGVPGVLVQTYAAARVREGVIGLRRVLASAVWTTAGAGALVMGSAALLSLLLPWPFQLRSELVPLAARLLLFAGAYAMIALPLRAVSLLYETHQQFRFLSLSQIATTSLRTTLTVLAIENDVGVIGMAWAQLVTVGVSLIVLVTALSRVLPGVALRPFEASLSVIRGLVHRGRLVAADNLGRVIAVAGDEFFIGILASTEAVALYNVAAKIPKQLGVALYQGATVLLPTFSAQHVEGDLPGARRLLLFATRTAIRVLLPLLLFAFLCAGPILEILAGARYAAGAGTMRWLLIPVLILTLSIPSDRVLYARNRVGSVVRITLVESLFNIALTILLVPFFGGGGAAFATALTHSVSALIWFAPTAAKALELPAWTLPVLFVRELVMPIALVAGAWLILGTFWSARTPLEECVRGLCAVLVGVPAIWWRVRR